MPCVITVRQVYVTSLNGDGRHVTIDITGSTTGADLYRAYGDRTDIPCDNYYLMHNTVVLDNDLTTLESVGVGTNTTIRAYTRGKGGAEPLVEYEGSSEEEEVCLFAGMVDPKLTYRPMRNYAQGLS